MFRTGGDTPTRRELLSMVKKRSELLSETTEEDDDVSDVEMDGAFWHELLDHYFICGKESRGRQDDDLVFFVRKLQRQGYGYNDNMEGDPPYFVRRWAPKLEDLISENSVEVDWRRSFYLNLVAHTSFSVTVAICSHQDLSNHQAGRNTPLTSMYKVVKTVYASPSRVDFHLDSRKEVETTPAYPDICFAIDDFDSTFDAVVLTERDHCYCVLLDANDGAAFPSERESQHNSSTNSSSRNSKITLFSGFVSYQMVRDAYGAGKSRFGSLLSFGQYPGKTDRIYMKGPGGRGEVEVAVSRVADQSQQNDGSFSPVISKRGFGIGSIVRKAAAVASVAAKHAIVAAAASSSADDEMFPLKCCLMSVSLPWKQIAYDFLFKPTGELIIVFCRRSLKLHIQSFRRLQGRSSKNLNWKRYAVRITVSWLWNHFLLDFTCWNMQAYMGHQEANTYHLDSKKSLLRFSRTKQNVSLEGEVAVQQQPMIKRLLLQS